MRPNEMFKTEKDFEYNQFETLEKEYKIKPFDKLDIRISTNDGYKLIDLSANMNMANQNRGFSYLVEYDGLVKVPTLGRINVSGLTKREAERFLEEKYAKFYQNPFVQIRVTNRKVYIFKQGGSQATVLNIPEENMTMIEALAQVGGLTDLEKSYKIKLIRGDVTNKPKVYNYNVYNLKDLKDSNLLLQANDIIYIESRPKYVSRVLNEINPYLNILSTILLIIGLASL